jgi:hypothetical protein
MKFKYSLLLIPAAMALAATRSVAATVMNYAGTAAVTARGDGPYTIGSIFQVNVTGVQITHLGVMDADNPGDAGNNGFADSDGFANDGTISVGLWSWDGTTATLLTPVTFTVGTTDTYSDGYRYAALTTPVDLVSGQQYILGARVGAGIEWFLDGGANPAQFSTTPGDFTLIKSTHNNGGAFSVAPTIDGTSTLGRWGAANAMYTIVPEPSTALLGGLGLLALLRRRR